MYLAEQLEKEKLEELIVIIKKKTYYKHLVLELTNIAYNII